MASFTNTIQALGALRAGLEAARQEAGATLGAIDGVRSAAGGASTAMAQFREESAATKTKTEEVKAAFSALDGVYSQVREASNEWDTELALQIEALRLGQTSLSEFMAMWGDARVATADGIRSIRELMDGFDARQYVQQIQDLIRGLQDGGATIGEVLDYLKKNAATLSKALVDAVEAFKRGELSLDALLKLIQKGKQDFAGTEFEALAQALGQALQEGRL